MARRDLGLIIVGGIIGYIFTDIIKGVKYLLESPPFLILGFLGLLMLLSGKAQRIPGDIVLGFSIGLAVRSQMASA